MADGTSVARKFDIQEVRSEFPILAREVNGKPLVYLDSAASAQKPRFVIDALSGQMETAYANVHRGLHTLANETTSAMEAARESARAFLNAGEVDKGKKKRRTRSKKGLKKINTQHTKNYKTNKKQ